MTTQPPDSPLVEQVARALYAMAQAEALALHPTDEPLPSFDDDDEDSRQFAFRMGRAALAVLQPLLDERQWRDIESAPRDKDAHILAYDGRDVYVAVWQFCDLPGWRVYMDGERSNPTHWMPLPEPPESKEPK
jgi:hypothetical protein